MATPTESSSPFLPSRVDADVATIVANAPKHETSGGSGITFREFLSDLNPLQYLPIVGTVYRAISGDTIPEPLREAGSMVVSGLTGGPIGLAISAALLAVEKVTGIDPERIGQQVLASLHIGAGAGTPTVLAQSTQSASGSAGSAAKTQASATEPSTQTLTLQGAWSTAELAAYGVKRSADGSLTKGNLSGADVLNAMVLAQLMPVANARRIA